MIMINLHGFVSKPQIRSCRLGLKMVECICKIYIFLSFFFNFSFLFFSDEGITETFECVEPLVGRYVSIVRSGVEDILSLCEVEVFSTMGLSAAASCEAEDLDDSRVAVFEGNCFHFMSQEVKGPKSFIYLKGSIKTPVNSKHSFNPDKVLQSKK